MRKMFASFRGEPCRSTGRAYLPIRGSFRSRRFNVDAERSMALATNDSSYLLC
jgi:hypothetical protein